MRRALHVLVLVLGLLAATSTAQTKCAPGQSCWPTTNQIRALYNSLDPQLPRKLEWKGGENCRVSAVPQSSPSEQPLFGLGTHELKPLYVRQPTDNTSTCFTQNSDGSFFAPEFCLASTRNYPYEDWQPAFVAFPLNDAHVQTLVRFANKHNLCVSVAGTGHDFLNRHSCPDGLFIRTSLMKFAKWDLKSTKDAPHGKVKFGPGLVWCEAHESAARRGRVINSGWASTVGVVGWALGGGHGPFGASFGLGVDNILGVKIVTANGELVIANNKTAAADLLWALRGGGGSTWGVITAITYRAFPIPKNGFTKFMVQAVQCVDETPMSDINQGLREFVQGHVNLITNADKRISGFTHMDAKAGQYDFGGVVCQNGGLGLSIQAVFLGGKDEPVFANFVQRLLNSLPDQKMHDFITVPNWGVAVKRANLEEIDPRDLSGFVKSLNYAGGVPSVLISSQIAKNGQMSNLVADNIVKCFTGTGTCARQELYWDLPSRKDSPKDPWVSVSSGFRNAALHLCSGMRPVSEMDDYYKLGSNSYFSESAYTMAGNSWQTRYWGSNYNKLKEIKTKYDPKNRFGCHNCITA
eukprot:Colp12_sorted_trinity150504_noHs@5171